LDARRERDLGHGPPRIRVLPQTPLVGSATQPRLTPETQGATPVAVGGCVEVIHDDSPTAAT
jgi:hypothetical protein